MVAGDDAPFTVVCTDLRPRQALRFCGDRPGHKRRTKGLPPDPSGALNVGGTRMRCPSPGSLQLPRI